MGKTLLIVNPCSGRAKMKTELLNVVNILSADGSLVTVYPTKARGRRYRVCSRRKRKRV